MFTTRMNEERVEHRIVRCGPEVKWDMGKGGGQAGKGRIIKGYSKPYLDSPEGQRAPQKM